MPVSACGEYEGEVIVGNDGTYLGDFDHGMAIDAPLGFSRSASDSRGIYISPTVNCGDWVSSPFWRPPYLTDSCVPLSTYPLPGPQPRVPIRGGAGFFGTLNGQIVADSSGPTGLEDMPAVEIDFCGSGSGYLSFIGETASQKAGEDPADYTDLWNPAFASRWVIQCWAKPVDDGNGYVMSDASMKLGYGRLEAAIFNAPIADAALDTDWKFFQTPFATSDSYPDKPAIPAFGATGGSLFNNEGHSVIYAGVDYTLKKMTPKGRLRLKCLHLYPEGATPISSSTGNWCDSFHGHG